MIEGVGAVIRGGGNDGLGAAQCNVRIYFGSGKGASLGIRQS